jgi:hypothetical protein
MIALAEWDCSIGVVSSYRLSETHLQGQGLPYTTTVMAGADLCRQQLTTSLCALGRPTTVLYRSEIIREFVPFYDESTLYEDIDACYRTLRSWNFGFVHQVLAFCRGHSGSNPGDGIEGHTEPLGRFLQLCKFGPAYLDRDELAVVSREWEGKYYKFLASRLLSGAKRAFWQFQRSGLRSVGQQLNRTKLLKHVLLHLLWMAANPGLATARVVARFRAR